MSSDDSHIPRFPPPGGTGGYRDLQARPRVAEAEPEERRIVDVGGDLLVMPKKKDERPWLKRALAHAAREHDHRRATVLRLVIVVATALGVLYWLCFRMTTIH